jgi:hypothetical protein
VTGKTPSGSSTGAGNGTGTNFLRTSSEIRPGPISSGSLALEFLAANPGVTPRAERPLPGVSHYYLGADPARWRTHVPQFAAVRLPALYDGIGAVNALGLGANCHRNAGLLSPGGTGRVRRKIRGIGLFLSRRRWHRACSPAVSRWL